MIDRLNVGSDAEMATRYPWEVTAPGIVAMVYAENAAPAVALFIAEYPDHGYPITVRLMSDGE